MEITGAGGSGGGGSPLTVTDGITPVVNVTTIDFTTGAVVSNGGAGIANVAISGSGGSTVFNDTVSGSINGTNKIFTVPNTITSPIVLFLANSSYQATVDYAVTGVKQITYTTAPDASLSGQPHWLAHT